MNYRETSVQQISATGRVLATTKTGGVGKAVFVAVTAGPVRRITMRNVANARRVGFVGAFVDQASGGGRSKPDCGG